MFNIELQVPSNLQSNAGKRIRPSVNTQSEHKINQFLDLLNLMHLEPCFTKKLLTGLGYTICWLFLKTIIKYLNNQEKQVYCHYYLSEGTINDTSKQ